MSGTAEAGPLTRAALAAVIDAALASVLERLDALEADGGSSAYPSATTYPSATLYPIGA